VQFLVTSDSPWLFATPPAVSRDGTLTYTPAAGSSGNAIVSLQLRDDGGTDRLGQDTSATETFQITVLANGTQCAVPPRAAESTATGNIRAKLSKGTLSIIGDAASNSVSIVAGSQPGYVRVLGAGGTTLNRRDAEVEFGPITRSIKVQLGGGDDYLVLDGTVGAMAVPGRLIVKESPGDSVILDPRRASSGNDTVAVIDALLEGGLDVRLRAGTDMVALCGTTIHGQVSLKTGVKADTVRIDDATMVDLALMSTGRGSDSVAIDTAGDSAGPPTRIEQCIRVKTKRGKDAIKLGSAGGPGNSVQSVACTKIRGGRAQDQLDAGLLDNPNTNGNELAEPVDVRGIEQQM
jgi:hypothetical protein